MLTNYCAGISIAPYMGAEFKENIYSVQAYNPSFIDILV